MILQRLAEHYDRLEAAGKGSSVPPGFSLQKVSFRIVLEEDGTLNSFSSMQVESDKGWKPSELPLPGNTKSSGSGENPCFLWDRTNYLLGWTRDPDPKKQSRAPKLFEVFKRRHLKYQAQFSSKRYDALCTFLKNWDPALFVEQLQQLDGIDRDCGVFSIAGEQTYLHHLFPKPVDWDDGKPKSKRSSVAITGQCLITGQLSEIARLHKPEIKGVFNSPPRGVPFLSMDKEAYCSYGKDQSFNAPVSTVAVFKYATTLNHLLRDRRIGLGDATVVFWADHAEPALEDCLALLFGGTTESATEDALPPEEDTVRVDEARRLLTQLRDGTRLTAVRPDNEPTKFYILGLSPNASRLSVRLWIEAAAPELERRLSDHLRDLALKTNFEERPLSLRALSNATGRYQAKGKTKFDTKGVSPQLIGELARSVLTGAAYPQSFLAAMVRRIRSDSYVGYERVSAIKACLIRNARLRGTTRDATKEIAMELDAQRDNIAYRCGRLFAMLEKAQTDSVDGELNSTIKEKYFAAASATPALVFPRLFRLNNHHLAKLEAPGRIFYGKLVASAMEAPFAFPKSLNLAEQGEFIVGYFQQQQDLYKKKPKSPEEKA